jgi:hypothetical protein
MAAPGTELTFAEVPQWSSEQTLVGRMSEPNPTSLLRLDPGQASTSDLRKTLALSAHKAITLRRFRGLLCCAAAREGFPNPTRCLP